MAIASRNHPDDHIISSKVKNPKGSEENQNEYKLRENCERHWNKASRKGSRLRCYCAAANRSTYVNNDKTPPA